jgi:hypothetical protein
MDKVFELPSQFKSLEKDLKDLTATMDAIDQRIENLRNTQGYNLNFNPPNFGQQQAPPQRQMEDLQNYKSGLQKDMKDRVKIELTHADEETAKEVTDKSDVRIDQNPYIKYSKNELDQKAPRENKDLDKSQDFTKVKLIHEKYEAKKFGKDNSKQALEIDEKLNQFINSTKHPASKDQPTAELDGNNDDLRKQFMNKLAYSKNAKDITEPVPNKGPEPEI